MMYIQQITTFIAHVMFRIHVHIYIQLDSPVSILSKSIQSPMTNLLFIIVWHVTF